MNIFFVDAFDLNGKPAISFNLDGEFKEHVFTFVKQDSLNCANEMIETASDLIDEDNFLSTFVGEKVITVNTKNNLQFLFRFDENDIDTAAQMIQTFVDLTFADDD